MIDFVNKKPMEEQALSQLSALITQEEKINSTLVVQSKASKKDYTYKLQSAQAKGKYPYTIFVKYEKGYNDFLACARSYQKSASLFKKFEENQSEVIKGAVYLLDKILKNQIKSLLSVANIYHVGRCIKCGKKLTDLESIEFGMGAHCRSIN